MQRMIIRGADKKQVEKRIREMKKRGWKQHKNMPEPKYDAGDLYTIDPSYVMVMEHPTLERTGKKVWY